MFGKKKTKTTKDDCKCKVEDCSSKGGTAKNCSTTKNSTSSTATKSCGSKATNNTKSCGANYNTKTKAKSSSTTKNCN